MESSRRVPTPDEAADVLREAHSVGAALARGLVLPSYFYSSIGLATAAQIGAAAVGIAAQDGRGFVLMAGGLLVVLCVGAIQIARFRAANGVRVRGLENRVVGGTAVEASTAYMIALGGAVWAAFSQAWWLVAMFSLLGGVGYAVSGQRWWQSYRRDPANRVGGDAHLWLTVLACVAAAGLVALALRQ